MNILLHSLLDRDPTFFTDNELDFISLKESIGITGFNPKSIISDEIFLNMCKKHLLRNEAVIGFMFKNEDKKSDNVEQFYKLLISYLYRKGIKDKMTREKYIVHTFTRNSQKDLQWLVNLSHGFAQTPQEIMDMWLKNISVGFYIVFSKSDYYDLYKTFTTEQIIQMILTNENIYLDDYLPRKDC